MCPETRGVLFAFSQRLSWAEGNPPVKFRPEKGQVLPQLRCSWASVYLLVGVGGAGRAGCRDSGAVVMLLEEYPADPRGVIGA